MKEIFKPFGNISNKTRLIIIISWTILFIGLFEVFHNPIIPTPSKILSSLIQLITSAEFFDNLINSFVLTLKAMFYSISITMLLVYLSTIPLFKPLTEFVSKCRYLTLTGLVFVFTVLSSDIGQLKILLLIFGIVPFFVTSFLSAVTSTPPQQIYKSYVNRNNRWRTLYEVIIIGKLDILFEVMRQNFAISWMMITTVEGYAMSEGGIGTMLIKSNKYLDLSPVFAMLIIVLILGLCADYILSKLRYYLFPYLKIKK